MDWISTFVTSTNGLPSPERFRLWAAIAAIAGVLERRVWSPSRVGILYPNLYVCLTGRSGSGKTQPINYVRNIWARIKEIKLSPDNMTNAAFYDALHKSGKLIGVTNGAEPKYYSAMAIPLREFGTLFPKYETGLLADFTDIFDNPDIFDSARRISKSVTLEAPTINMLAGATPSYLGEFLPEVAWTQGFCSRFIFVYGERPALTGVDLLIPSAVVANLKGLANELETRTKAHGEFVWDPAAHAALNLWNNDDKQLDVPKHSRLQEYSTRRDIYVMKLSMISAMSEDKGLVIHRSDFDRALNWLTEAEAVMPELFTYMVSGTDSQVIQDLHHHLYVLHVRKPLGQRDPITTGDIWRFLRNRVEAWRINSIVETAEKSGVIKRSQYPEEWHVADY